MTTNPFESCLSSVALHMSSIIQEVSLVVLSAFEMMSLIQQLTCSRSQTGTIGFMVVSLHEMNPLSLGFVILPLGFQHLVVFIKYRFKHLHAFLLLCLEVWFQLESYYALTFATTSARVSIGMLLISHYSKFFIAANTALFLCLCFVL